MLKFHPPQPTGGHAEQGLQIYFQPLQYLVMDIHGCHTNEQKELSLHIQFIAIIAFHSASDLCVSQCRTLGFICTLAGCKTSHPTEFYMEFALHPQRLRPPFHTNQRNYCCNIMVLHCHKQEVDWRQYAPVLAFMFHIWVLSVFFQFMKVSGNLQLLLFRSGRQTFFVKVRVLLN